MLSLLPSPLLLVFRLLLVRIRNGVLSDNFDFLTDGNSGVHKGVVRAALSRASDLG